MDIECRLPRVRAGKDLLDIELRQGEIVAVLGKTDAPRKCFQQLIDPTDNEHFPFAPHFSLVFNQPTLLSHLTVFDNVALPRKFAGFKHDATQARTMELLEYFGIGHLAKARPASLTVDEATRAAFARAWSRKTEQIMIHDPFAALDTASRRDLIDDIHRLWLNTEDAPAMLLFTQEADTAAYFAQRAVILDIQGRLTGQNIEIHGTLPRPNYWRTTVATQQVLEQLTQAQGAYEGVAK